MWPYVPCQVCEPVAVEVAEEHLGLAYVRVTVQSIHRITFAKMLKMARLSLYVSTRLCLSSDLAHTLCAQECLVSSSLLTPRPRPQMRNGRNRNRKWCLLFFSHTPYFFLPPPPPPPHRHTAGHHTHTHTHAHTLFCTTRDTVARTHTASDGHTRVHPRATTYAANHTSTLWLNCRVQRHAVGITHVESSEEVIAHCH